MSSFLETKPVRGVHFLAYAVAIAAVSFTLNFAFVNFMTKCVAENEAAEKIEAARLTVVAKFKAAEQKKLPKGAKPDPQALNEAAEKAFAADHKATEAFGKKEHEIHHHAVAGTYPMVSFIAVVSGIVGGLAAALLVVRRTKDSALPAWPAFLAHVPVFASYMFVAFLPFLLGLSAHDEGGVVALIRSDAFLATGVVVALAGIVFKLLLAVLPSRPQADGHDCHAH